MLAALNDGQWRLNYQVIFVTIFFIVLTISAFDPNGFCPFIHLISVQKWFCILTRRYGKHIKSNSVIVRPFDGAIVPDKSVFGRAVVAGVLSHCRAVRPLIHEVLGESSVRVPNQDQNDEYPHR